METPSFTFRLGRVRNLRERAEEHAREELEGGATYLRRPLDRFGADVARTLAAYSAAPGADGPATPVSSSPSVNGIL